MTRIDDRQLARLLRDEPGLDVEPPPELLARLLADVPTSLAATPPRDGGDAPFRSVPMRYLVYRPAWIAAAASLVMVVGGGLLAWRVARQAPPLAPAVLAETDLRARARAAGDAAASSPATPPAAPRLAPPEVVEELTAVGYLGEGGDAAEAEGREMTAEELARVDAELAAARAGAARAAADDAAPAAPSAREGDAWGVLQSTPGVVTDRLAVGGNESGQRQGAGSAREIADQAAPTAGAPTGVPGGAVVGEAVAVSEPAPSAPAPPPARAERPRAAAMAQAPAAAPAPPPPAESAAKATEAGGLEDRRAVTGGTLGRAASEAFAETEDARRSTFRLDAGSASYDAVRRFLLDGRLPPAEAVRVEELVNAFDYGDAPPRDGDFALRLEGAPSPWASGERYYLLRVAVTARPPRTEAERVASAPVAQQVRAQVEFDPRSVARWRLLGYESQVVAEHRFRDERTGGGAIAGGHTATAVYELRLQPQAAPGAAVALLRLRWLPAGATRFAEAEQVLRASELVPYWEAASRGFRLATTVARFGEVLQGSHWVVGEDLLEVARRAEAVAADWPRQERVRELARLVATAAELQRRRR